MVMNSPYQISEDTYYIIIQDNMPKIDIGINAWFLVLSYVSDSFQYYKIFVDILNVREDKYKKPIQLIFTKSLQMLISDFYDSLDDDLQGKDIENAKEILRTGRPNVENIMSITQSLVNNSTMYAFDELEKITPDANIFKVIASDMITLLLGLLCFKNNILLPIGAGSINIFSKNYNQMIYAKDIDYDSLVEERISVQNKSKADSRWSKHNKTRPEKKKQYLNIMRDKKFTTFADTATYIKQHVDIDKSPSHDTVCRWLSQANKGNFS